MKSAISIQVLPMGTVNREELYRYVDKAIAVIEESGLSYTVGTFETTVRGELDEVWDVAYKAHRAVLDDNNKQVISFIKIASGEGILAHDKAIEEG